MPDEERIEQLELEVKVLRANNKGLKDKIDEQSKEIEELNKSDASKEQSSMKHYNLYKELVDKIKARIKELEEYLYKGNIKDDFLMIRIKAKIQELQSLLEKE